MARREGEEVKVFLMGDAASCAKKDQKVPQGYCNLEVLFDGQAPAPYDLLVAIPPHRPPALARAAGIAAEIRGAAATDTFCGDGFCMLEAGEDLAGVAFGDFFHQPSPDVQVKSLGKA